MKIIFSSNFTVSADSSHETTTFDISENPENVEDFVFKGKESVSKGLKLQISSGSQATNTQFPYVAELAINTATGGYLCTGSLIAPNWILTARHCIAGYLPVNFKSTKKIKPPYFYCTQFSHHIYSCIFRIS